MNPRNSRRVREIDQVGGKIHGGKFLWKKTVQLVFFTKSVLSEQLPALAASITACGSFLQIDHLYSPKW